jgi:hypothetical protein
MKDIVDYLNDTNYSKIHAEKSNPAGCNHNKSLQVEHGIQKQK